MAWAPAGSHIDRQRIDQMLARDLACRTLGIQLDRVGSGRADLHMRVSETMANGHGTAHGGYLFLLADAAFAYASNSRDAAAVAQHAEITFLRPVATGTLLRAEARERAQHGRSGLYDVTLRRDDGAAVAEFRGHSVLLLPPDLDHSAEH
jgi:acyl-CoA thioesterase